MNVVACCPVPFHPAARRARDHSTNVNPPDTKQNDTALVSFRLSSGGVRVESILPNG